MEELTEEQLTYLSHYGNSWQQIRHTLRHEYRLFNYEYLDRDKLILYSEFYKFIYDNINTKWDDMNITPCHFFFNSSEVLEATAISASRAFTINSGLIEELITHFKNYSDYLQQTQFLRQPDFIRSLDVPVYYLIFQATTQFLYYHELAHIIQYLGTNRVITENNAAGGGGEYDFDGHIMEMDADEFASFFIVNHTTDYWLRKLPVRHQTSESLDMLLAFLEAGVFTLFYCLSGKKNVEYYENDHSHPHNVIRYNNSVAKITSVARGFYDQRGLEFDTGRIFQQANVIMRHIVGDDVVEHSRAITNGKMPEIAQFIFTKQEQISERAWTAGSKMRARNN